VSHQRLHLALVYCGQAVQALIYGGPEMVEVGVTDD
jgi:hypothetical protein